MKLYYDKAAMGLHGDNAIKYMDFEPYSQGSDPAMFWLYSPADYEKMLLHDGKKYVFFHGTDVLILRQNKSLLTIFRECDPVCACHNQVQRDVLAEMGIYAVIRPVFWNDITKYKISEVETKDIYITSHLNREIEYGEFMVNAVAAAMPDWTFHIFGTNKSFPVKDNVKYYGTIPEEEMDELTKDMYGTLRWKKIQGTHWDGFSQTSMKALLRGQMLISGIDYPYYHCNYVKDLGDILECFDEGEADYRFEIELNNFDWIK